MNYRQVGLLVVVGSLVVLSGCVGGMNQGAVGGSDNSELAGTLSTVYFVDDGVVCHPYSWGEAGGLDCSVVDSVSADDDVIRVSGTPESVSVEPGSLARVEYPDEGQVCYVYTWGEAGGVDCVDSSEMKMF